MQTFRQPQAAGDTGAAGPHGAASQEGILRRPTVGLGDTRGASDRGCVLCPCPGRAAAGRPEDREGWCGSGDTEGRAAPG